MFLTVHKWIFDIQLNKFINLKIKKMKFDLSLVVNIAIAIVLVRLLDKFVLSKIGAESFDSFGNYDGEEFQ